MSTRSRPASVKKARGVAEPVEPPPRYLQPTPKVRATSTEVREKTSKRPRESRAGNKDLSSEEVEPAESEHDHNPLEEEADYVANPEKVRAEASAESYESEEEESQESDQEVTDEKLTTQFNRLRTSAKPKEAPPAVSVKKADHRPKVDETGSRPVRPHGDISRLKGILFAILQLSSPCQGLLTFEDTLGSNRLPGNKLIIQGCRAIELKILMHRQGHRLHLIQRDEEVEDDLQLTDLSENLRLHVLEEQIPRGDRAPHLQYTVNQGLAGTTLAGDPRVPCWLSPHTPRFVSCIQSETQHSVVIL